MEAVTKVRKPVTKNERHNIVKEIKGLPWMSREGTEMDEGLVNK